MGSDQLYDTIEAISAQSRSYMLIEKQDLNSVIRPRIGSFTEAD